MTETCSTALLPKPEFGQPCNGCGICCMITQCAVSVAMFGEHELCPALQKAGRSFACGLMVNTADYVPDITAWGGKTLTETFTLMIGAGIGCDGTLEDDETDEAHATMLQKAEAKIAAASPEAQMLVAYFRASSHQPKEGGHG